MICYAYPPYEAIGSVRSSNLSKEFSQYFDEVRVITTRNINKNQIVDNSKNISVTRLFTLDYDLIRKGIKKIRPKSNKLQKAKPVIENSKPSILSRLLNSFPFNLIFGLGGLIYILHGMIMTIKHIDDDTVIFSSFSPVSDHIIAWFAKKIYPKSYWIADYRDAFFMPDENRSVAPKMDSKIHQGVLNKADLTTVVSHGLKNHFSQYTSKLEVIRNASTITGNPRYLEPVSMNKFRVVYTGRLYQNKRNPSLLFEAIEELLEEGKIAKDTLEVVHAGSESAYWNSHAEKYSFDNVDLGLVSMEEARNLQISSNILLMMNWNLPKLLGVLSGKLFEYFEIGNPVLAIIDGYNDEELNNIFTDLNAGMITYVSQKDIVGIKSFVLKYYRNWEKDAVSEKIINRERLKKYSWTSVVKQFIQSVDAK